MRGTDQRPILLLLSAVLLVAGCSRSAASVASAPSAAPSPTVAPTATPASSPTPATPPSPTPAVATARPTATADWPSNPGKVRAGTAAVTVVDGVRVRSKPAVSDDSAKFEPLLPLGTRVSVLDGPVSASGYDWYDVKPVAGTLPGGWVASRGRDGDLWLVAADFDCPPLPTDFRSLAALPSPVGLVCFPRKPITIQARLVGCHDCDDIGGQVEPYWFRPPLVEWTPLLVEPAQTQPSAPFWDHWFPLILDPTGRHPDPLPLGKIVEVTGMFDHPAAATCTYTEPDGEPVPSQSCRLRFAVTRLVTARP